MRKNSARKWLHATLDLLPVVIIPIFALYATNKNATFAQEITVSENKVVDFNQLYRGSNITSFNVVTTYDEDLIISKSVGLDNEIYFNSSSYGVPVINQHYYYMSVEIVENNGDMPNVFGLLNAAPYVDNLQVGISSSIMQSNATLTSGVGFVFSTSGNNVDLKYRIQITDLTQMFGSGNEPTLTQFNQWYSNNSYEYTISEKQLLKNYDQITYNDTDIGSQFMYGLYNSVDKYFNIGNVFNLGSIYDWLNLNIFNGNSPIAIYIVWNIVAYEFLMDLLFLLYGLFMFFIDTCTNLMDRFYCNLSGRR